MADTDILFSREGDWGVITLDRQKALNSLTKAMCEQMDAQLRQWADDDSVHAVLVEGAGDRAFCAGGDIRWLATTAKESAAQAATFFRVEYKLNNQIAHFPKPYVALVDGICMGGGVGISAMATRRVMTERVMWAMPECGIGLMPDVGASYFLPRLEGGMGMYLALTGTRLNGADCRAIGLATHLTLSERLDDLCTNLLQDDLTTGALEAIDAVLSSFDAEAPSELAKAQRSIDEHFGRVTDPIALIRALEAADSDFATAALKSMQPGSPTSMALTVQLLNDAPENFSDCMRREFCVAAHLMEGPDFLEGVRAQIIDKDRNPQWNPATIKDVQAAAIDRYFTEPERGPLALA